MKKLLVMLGLPDRLSGVEQNAHVVLLAGKCNT
jgi:hypothetical protein